MKESDHFTPTLLNAGLASLDASWNYRNVNSSFGRIYLVKSGFATLLFPDRTEQPLDVGHLYFIPPYTTHGYRCDTTCALYYLHVFEQQHQSRRLFEDCLYPLRVDASTLDYALVERLLHINPCRELHQYDPKFYDNSATLLQCIEANSSAPQYRKCETEGILLQLFAHFMARATDKFVQTDNRIMDVVRFVRKNIRTQIGMPQMLALSCMSKDHFIKVFKREIGTTPVQYVIRTKIEQAQLLLSTTDLSIKDVALSLSMENICYFNRLFKRHVGTTPARYRARRTL